MLVKNLTGNTLNLRRCGKKKELPPRAITVVNELDFSAEYVKQVYGNFIQIMTESQPVITEEEVDEQKVSTETEGNMEEKEGSEDLQPADEANAEDKGDDVKGDEADTTDTPAEDANNDNGSSDELGDSKDEAGQEEADGEKEADKTEETTEEVVTEVEAEKAPKKKNKKSSKK
jgi:hypothetical protein